MSVFDQDDLGLPQNPIYSNYSQHLWKSHAGRRAVLKINGSQQKTELTASGRVDALPAVIGLAPVAEEDKINKAGA